MNCYEWQHNISLSGMSISADCSYEIDDPSDPANKLNVTISGIQTYPDTAGPYPRRALRCGVAYGKPYAKRSDWRLNYGRFVLVSDIQSDNGNPLTVTMTNAADSYAAIYDGGFLLYPKFIGGLFKPEDTSDPAYVCADGVWRKSTEITKGAVQIFSESGDWLAVGFFQKIENGAEITYFQPYDRDNAIGTGAISYTLT